MFVTVIIANKEVKVYEAEASLLVAKGLATYPAQSKTVEPAENKMIEPEYKNKTMVVTGEIKGGDIVWKPKSRKPKK